MRSFKTINWVKIKYYKGIRSVMPTKSGVYCFVYRNKVMYVGSYSNLKNRINFCHGAILALSVMNKLNFSVYYYVTKLYGVYEGRLTIEIMPPLNRNIGWGYKRQGHYINDNRKLINFNVPNKL